MTDDTWGLWQEHTPGHPCPIPGVFAGDYSIEYFDCVERTFTNLSSDECLGWISGDITRYRLRKTAAAPAPAVDWEVEANKWEALARDAVKELALSPCPTMINNMMTAFECTRAGQCGCGNASILDRVRKAGVE